MKKVIGSGLRAARTEMFKEDKIWSRYSNDKVDIGKALAKVIRTLHKSIPLSKKMRALSIGSSNEPQFRILETAFRGGLYLVDIEKKALDVVRERIQRQFVTHVKTIQADYGGLFLREKTTKEFFRKKLNGKKVELIIFHHSLYYAQEQQWNAILENLFKIILARKGAIHIVLMSSKSRNPYSTTWLYNHFAGKFFNHKNDQDILRFKKVLAKNQNFKKTQIISKTSNVKCLVKDFNKFMAVIWMVLLYPNVHRYNLAERKEIADFIYDRFYRKKRPLVQQQDHVVIYRDLGFKGLI
ncbi:MAG: class I SAM-dependent methyltransferase [Candidatus Omnitrophica bacterium]|nr:class I SAM-dependent methyltransferase [Candidatus Omnitrophota bacterium]